MRRGRNQPVAAQLVAAIILLKTGPSEAWVRLRPLPSRTLLALGIIGSFGNVLSEDTKWKRVRWIASPSSLGLYFKSR